MEMTSHLVYDLDTGEVVHVHVEPAELRTSREEIIELAGPRGRQRLDVLEVPGGRLPTHPLRVEDGELREADASAAIGEGSVAGGFVEPAERRYERLRPRKGARAAE